LDIVLLATKSLFVVILALGDGKMNQRRDPAFEGTSNLLPGQVP